MPSTYLVRHGLMGRVGPFSAGSGAFERGQTVLIDSARGRELGEILAPAPSGLGHPESSTILRGAGRDDVARAEERAGLERPRLLAACDRVFGEGVWPFSVVDVEPLLDDRRTVIYYLGPHQLDTSGLRQTFRDLFDLDAHFEPVGLDEPADSCGSSCGSGGCGSGGCGPRGTSGGHGCEGCAVKGLIDARRQAPAAS